MPHLLGEPEKQLKRDLKAAITRDPAPLRFEHYATDRDGAHTFVAFEASDGRVYGLTLAQGATPVFRAC
jgi:hypothetical protein